MPRKSDTTGEDETTEDTTPVVPTEQIVTLTLKQRAYWRGKLCEAGTKFDYPKAQADEILTTTELFTAV